MLLSPSCVATILLFLCLCNSWSLWSLRTLEMLANSKTLVRHAFTGSGSFQRWWWTPFERTVCKNALQSENGKERMEVTHRWVWHKVYQTLSPSSVLVTTEGHPSSKNLHLCKLKISTRDNIHACSKCLFDYVCNTLCYITLCYDTLWLYQWRQWSFSGKWVRDAPLQVFMVYKSLPELRTC